ncbi:hypothetical protein [Frankia sp. CcI49]|nr:hypothetical protein [Frankia sp. CcI49]
MVESDVFRAQWDGVGPGRATAVVRSPSLCLLDGIIETVTAGAL